MVKNILFIANLPAVSGVFARLKDDGFEAGMADNLKGALRFIEKERPALILTQPALPGYRAEELLTLAREQGGAFPPVVVFTDRGTAEEARQCLEAGAFDYWLAPLQWEKILACLPKDSPGHPEVVSPAGPGPAPTGKSVSIIGNHPAIKRVLALAKQVAPSKATVLISGESGTGKEMFGRFLHINSSRADKPFIALNCAALPEHLLESELFGHEKGAFTGAISRKPGKFELAHNGTMFLDEVSEMEIGLQAKLLRVLQEGEFDRVGGIETIKVDVRVIATTNRNLDESIKKGEFRQDLFYRLNVIPLKLPPLRERRDDIALLAQFFADNYCRNYGLPRMSFADDAIQYLMDYAWPGNVRELQNLMERAVLLAGIGPIRRAHFLLEGEEFNPDEIIPEDSPPSAQDTSYTGDIIPLQEMEKRLILKSLDQTSGNRTQAAELLGISVRTLRNKLNEYREQGMIIP